MDCNYSFIWDDEKFNKNLIEHNVSFEEAKTVFNDAFAIIEFDDKHSTDTEDRFHIIGLSDNANLLLVCHCYLKNNVVRIISAWKATSEETKRYIGE